MKQKGQDRNEAVLPYRLMVTRSRKRNTEWEGAIG
jgi:hypothetical protein